MKRTKLLLLALLVLIISGLSTSAFAKQTELLRLSKAYKENTKQEALKKVLKAGEVYPIASEIYQYTGSMWRLIEIDTLKHDSDGRVIETNSTVSGTTEYRTYDSKGNLTEVLTKTGGENSTKKVYTYDPMLEDYRTESISYGWVNGKWEENYHHIKEVVRDKDNNIINIFIWTISGDTALNSSFGMVYENGRAVSYYAIDNFDGKVDTIEAYTNMVWAKWKGQLVEDDFFYENQLKSAMFNDGGEAEIEGIFKEGSFAFSWKYSDNTREEFAVDSLDEYGSFASANNYYETEAGVETLISSMRYTEKYDEHQNLAESLDEIAENGGEYEIMGKIIYDNVYDEGKFMQYTIMEYNIETAKLDSMERVVYIYQGVGKEEHNSLSANLSVYPNPVKENISFSANGNFDKLRILNLTGKVLYQESLGNSSALNTVISGNYNVSSLAPGLYIIELSGKDGVAVKKFLRANN